MTEMARERSNAALDSRGSVRQAQQDGARGQTIATTSTAAGQTVADAPTLAQCLHACLLRMLWQHLPITDRRGDPAHDAAKCDD
jgi:hypothetical protein